MSEDTKPSVHIHTEVRVVFDISGLAIRKNIIRSGKSTEVQLSTMHATWTRIRTGRTFYRPQDVQIDANLIGAHGTPVKKSYRFDMRREELKPELRALLDGFDAAAAEKEDIGE